MQQRPRFRLEGKVAMVTGAGSSGPGVGTGKATAILFAREGAKVLLVDRSLEQAEQTLAAIKEEGGEASVFEADVTNTEDCRAMVETAVERYGGVNVLFNNVGILGRGSVVDVDEDHWDQVLNVNLKSMVLTSKYAIPRMAEGGGGSIINVSSIAGIRAGSGGAAVPYAASKSGIIGLTATMAVTHGRDNIRVNCIAPGHIYNSNGGRDHAGRISRPAPPRRATGHRGRRLGHRLGGSVPGQRRIPLGLWHRYACGCRSAGRHPTGDAGPSAVNHQRLTIGHKTRSS